MMERYEPKADFLKAVLNESVVCVGAGAAGNLEQLISFTQDGDPVNRDWAALLLSQQEIDTPEVRSALLKVATEDGSLSARAEAIAGLAQRAPALALPLVQRALTSGKVTAPILEAAELLADRSLTEDLRAYATPSDNAYLDSLAASALRACGG